MMILEAACAVYIAGCLLAVALDLYLHRSWKPRRKREDVSPAGGQGHR